MSTASIDLNTSTDDVSTESVQLMAQINELQSAVRDMKLVLTSSLQQLGQVGGEESNSALQERVEESQQQMAEVLRLVMALKSEFSTVRSVMQQTQERQSFLDDTIRTLVADREMLLEELLKNGIISDHVRLRLHPPPRVSVDRASSGAPSNDSGVALLLEKAQAAFGDTSLLQEPRPPGTGFVSQVVTEYLAGLGNTERQPPGDEAEGCMPTYDSDSSLTLAANKSLSLSTSLSQQCGLELDDMGPRGQQMSDSEDDTRDGNCRGHRGLAGGDVLVWEVEVHRLRVAKELVETEQHYCRTLWILQDTFAQPLHDNRILPAKDVNTLFPEEVFHLYDRHCVLLQQLEERVARWREQPTVGDLLEVFTDPRTSDVLRLYTSYVNDFPEVLKTFHKLCRTSAEFMKFLKMSLEHPNCAGLDLGAFLLTPVQRIPRYVLLLKQLLRHTVNAHPDHEPISTCLDRLRNYLARLNDSMEHSFQLVTAQISGNNKSSNNSRQTKQGSKTPKTPTESFEYEYFSKDTKLRSSLTHSESSESSGQGQQARKGKFYKQNKLRERSVSVPRTASSGSNSGSGRRSGRVSPSVSYNGSLVAGSCRTKLKSRSRSEWTVSDGERTRRKDLERCRCRSHNQSGQPRRLKKNDLTVSDSDLNSSLEEYTGTGSRQRQSASKRPVRAPNLPVSKSLHTFQQIGSSLATQNDLACSEPSLCDSPSNHDPVSLPVESPRRPLSNARSVHDVSADKEEYHSLQLEDTSTLEKKKRKHKLRNSLKNMFSFKKRGTSRVFHISPTQLADVHLDGEVVMTQYDTTGTSFRDEDGNTCTDV